MTMTFKPSRTLIELLALALAPAVAQAVDNAASQGAPDLAPARARIAAKDFTGAVAVLQPMAVQYQNPDVYNLLGFSYRKSGDLKQAATYYGKALDFVPNFKPAIEYQGELYLQLGDLDKAKANLAKLATLCPSGCEERADLEQAIASVKTN